MKTLLQIVTDVCDELALMRPASVIGTQDPQIRQLFALLSRLGRDIVKQFDWERLDKEALIQSAQYTDTGVLVEGSNIVTGLSVTANLSTKFTVMGEGIMPFAQITSVGATQIVMDMPAEKSGTFPLTFQQNRFDLPVDWDREIPQTEWNRTTRWPLLGPKSAQEWQSFKSGIVSAGPRQRFRIVGNKLVLNPSPPPGELLSLEYISNAWIVGADGSEKTEFTADTDTTVFGDSLMVTGLKTQWKQAKGLDFSFDLGEFRALLEQEKAQDKSAPRLYLSQASSSILMTDQNIPDGSWPGN